MGSRSILSRFLMFPSSVQMCTFTFGACLMYSFYFDCWISSSLVCWYVLFFLLMMVNSFSWRVCFSLVYMFRNSFQSTYWSYNLRLILEKKNFRFFVHLSMGVRMLNCFVSFWWFSAVELVACGMFKSISIRSNSCMWHLPIIRLRVLYFSFNSFRSWCCVC